MSTDKERREVARKLKSWEWKAVSPKCLLNSLVFDDECPGMDDDPDTITCQECVYIAAHRLADLIEPKPERTCIPVVMEYHDKRLEDFYLVECSECKGSFGGMFFEKEKAEAFAKSLPIYYLKYCQRCGAKIVKNKKPSKNVMKIYEELLKGLEDAN